MCRKLYNDVCVCVPGHIKYSRTTWHARCTVVQRLERNSECLILIHRNKRNVNLCINLSVDVRIKNGICVWVLCVLNRYLHPFELCANEHREWMWMTQITVDILSFIHLYTKLNFEQFVFYEFATLFHVHVLQSPSILSRSLNSDRCIKRKEAWYVQMDLLLEISLEFEEFDRLNIWMS